MLLPAIVGSILLYGGLALAGLGVLGFKVAYDERKRRDDEANRVPEAKLVGAKDPDRLWRIVPPAMIAVGLGLAFVMGLQTTDVIIVTDDGGSVSASRKVRVFGSDDYKLAPGHTPSKYAGDPTWIVNESSRVVRVKTVNYGRTLGWGRDEPTKVPPGTAVAERRIDHIGPSDPPPSTVMDSTKLGMSWRYWLIWD